MWAPGSVALPPTPAGKRLLRALSFFDGGLPNPYDRPVEGLVATVDMNALTVIDVTDTGIKPVNTTLSGSSDTTRPGLKPLNVVQPDGPSFTLKGNAVEWMGWQFRVGFNPREGLVLHEIGFEDDGVVRPIIQRMALDEIFVPYALPDGNWVWRAALDFGEYNLGQYSESLEAGVDVPTNAVFFDEAVPLDDPSGDPSYDLPHAIALYERDGGSLWDRLDPATFERDARFARELVVTASMVIGNYTYMVDYVFRLDGSIDVRAGATGTTLNRGIAVNGTDERFGGTVSPNISAPNHQHFFNFRIDFDVDGPANRLVEANTQSVPSTFGNALSTTETALTTEGFRDINPTTTRHWAVESTTAQNALGEPTAYEIEPARGGPRLRRPVIRAAPARAVRAARAVGHALQGRRAVRGRRLSQPGPGGRGSAEVRLRSRQRRRQGPGGLVHRGVHPSHPGRGLPGHDARDRRLLAAAGRVLRPERGARRPVSDTAGRAAVSGESARRIRVRLRDLRDGLAAAGGLRPADEGVGATVAAAEIAGPGAAADHVCVVAALDPVVVACTAVDEYRRPVRHRAHPCRPHPG